MRYSDSRYYTRKQDNIIDQYLENCGFRFNQILTSNKLYKIVFEGSCNKKKLLSYFSNHSYLPKLNVIIDHFKCDGNNFSCTIKVENLQKLEDSVVKGYWRDKQIEEILND